MHVQPCIAARSPALCLGATGGLGNLLWYAPGCWVQLFEKHGQAVSIQSVC